MTTIKKLFIANRAEIALRIVRTARRMGIATVVPMHSDDRFGPALAEADETVEVFGTPAVTAWLDIPGMIRAAIDSGCDAVHPGYGFLSENAAFSKAVADAASKSSGSLMIAQVVRFFLGYQKLREVSESGELGKLLSVHARRFSPKPTWATWLGDESQSGGMLVDFSIHDFDQINMYLGKPVEVFAAQTSQSGPAEITVKYEGGGVGQVQSFMNAAEGVPFTSTIDLLGTSGIAHYEFSAISATEESSSGNNAGVNSWHVFSSKGNTVEQIASDDPYGRQVKYFFDQASSGGKYDLSPTPSAIAALQVCLAAKASLKEGRPVAIS